MRTNRIVVYLATPMRKGDWRANIVNASLIAADLMEMGFSVINPVGSWLPDLVAPLTIDQWLANDYGLIEASDCVYRVEGVSEGADKECYHAQQNGIPIFYDLESLCMEYIDDLICTGIV